LKFAEELGADSIATGHYAAIGRDEQTGRNLLKKGRDHEKDQSYFLYSLSQEQLSRILFPLGEMTKKETRETAKSFALHISEKPASQDVCFLGNEDYRAFLTRRFSDLLVPGPFVNPEGRELGHHRGIACYTVGQRRGLGLAAGVPLYVLAIEPETKTIIVGTREESFIRGISLDSVNWIAMDPPDHSLLLHVKIRYRQKERKAWISPGGKGRAEIHFLEPQPPSATGQSAVFYDGNVVIGGGIIRSIIRDGDSATR
jgi:tRNA-specific 2-thiouridylase